MKTIKLETPGTYKRKIIGLAALWLVLLAAVVVVTPSLFDSKVAMATISLAAGLVIGTTCFYNILRFNRLRKVAIEAQERGLGQIRVAPGLIDVVDLSRHQELVEDVRRVLLCDGCIDCPPGGPCRKVD